MTMWSPSWRAAIRTVPEAGLPAATRASGDSTPWSTALRMMWTSGSLISSRTFLSSSVSAPSMTRSTCFLKPWARSRTALGYALKMVETGSIRSCMPCSCRSDTTVEARETSSW
jgi:hypothetical protein